MKKIGLATVVILGLCGCSPASQNPDAIRQDATNATAAIIRDGKALIQGIFDGLKTKGALNINKATKDELKTLPGIDNAAADRIIAGRPYKNSIELRQRHILGKAEYNRIADRIQAR